MEALTQCWFTRIHLPDRHRHREEDGSTTAICRYCFRRIVSWDRSAWALADGFNVSRLAEIAGRTLTLFDTAGDFVVHRYTVAHLNDEAVIDALKEQLRAEYGLDEPDTTMELRDSAAPVRRKPPGKVSRSAQARSALSRSAPDNHRSA